MTLTHDLDLYSTAVTVTGFWSESEFQISLYMGKSEEELQADFSIVISSTVPHQILSNDLTDIAYGETAFLLLRSRSDF